VLTKTRISVEENLSMLT